MGDIVDASYLLNSSLSEDVERVGDESALAERLNEWFQTPMGTVADMPEWGHNLSSFKFDPDGADLEVAMELAIVEKLQSDISNIIFLGVRVSFSEIDLCEVVIRHQFGDTISKIQL